jgi:N-acetylglucosaminyldiphosphoundecaprenol N-acetyl-beta-D-mannosaminyltransferase
MTLLFGVDRSRADGVAVAAGLRLAGYTENELVDLVRSRWRDGGWIVTANVDVLRTVDRRPQLRELVADAIVVADGMPVVWASRVAGMSLPERVTGASLIHSLSAAAAADGRSVYLLGGDPGVPQRAAEMLRRANPGLAVAGTDSPPFGFDRSSTEVERVVARVRDAAPDLVLAGLGFPRQELLIEQLRVALPNAWFLGCGAAIAMAAGQFRRANPTLQRMGLEWAHRLWLEPGRLVRRYLGDDAPFALTLLAHAGAHRARRPISRGAALLRRAR